MQIADIIAREIRLASSANLNNTKLTFAKISMEVLELLKKKGFTVTVTKTQPQFPSGKVCLEISWKEDNNE